MGRRARGASGRSTGNAGARAWRPARPSVAALSGRELRFQRWTSFLLSRGRRERVAGQPQVDVVESRLAGADRAGEPELVDRGDRFAGARVVERNGEPRADGEGVPAGNSVLAQRDEGAADVPVDADLDQLL